MREKPRVKLDQESTHSTSDTIRLDEIVNRSPAIAFVWRTEKGWPVEYVSDNIRKFGYTPQDFYSGNLNFESIMHPEDLDRIIAEIDAYNKKKATEFSLEYRILTSDKETRWLDSRTWVKRDEKGEILMYQGVVLDITERKRIENELKNRETHLRLITDNMVDVISQLDANMNTLYTSPSLERVVGVRPEEVIGRPAFGWIHPDDLEPTLRKAAEARKAGLPSVSLEYRWRGANGEFRWVESVARLLYDENGLPSGSILVSRDCHERKMAIQALQENEERLRMVTDNMADVVTQLDDNLNFIYLSPSISRLMGYHVEDLLGKSITEIIFPDDMDRILLESNKARKAHRRDLTIEYRCRHANGEYRWAESNVQLLYNDRGESAGNVISTRDITSRKHAEGALRESEEKFRSIVEQSLAGIFKVDDSYHFVYANDELCHILDYPKEELIGMNFQDALAEESRAMVSGRYIRRQRGEQVPSRYELKIKCKSGEIRDAEMIVTVVKDSVGKPSTMGQLVDITDRKKAEEVIKTSERRLLEALQVAKMGYWEYDALNNLLTFNDQYYSLHKTTVAAVGGYQMSAERFAEEFIFPDDVPVFRDELNRVMTTSDSEYQKQFDARLVCADGKVRWFNVWFRMEKDDEGRAIKLHGVSQDIHDRKLAEEKVQHHAAHAEALARTATQINRQIDLDTTLTSVCENTVKVFNTRAAVIILVDSNSNTVNAISGYGLPFDYRKEIPAIPLSVLNKALNLFPDGPQVVQDYKSKARIPGDDLIKKHDIKTIAFTRIKWQRQLIGVLIVLSIGNHRNFDDDELSLLQSLADESAQAIMNTRYLNDASRRLERLEALRTIDNAIAASLDLRHTLAVFLDQLHHQLNIDAADILLFNPHSLTYEYAFGVGMHTDKLSLLEVRSDEEPIEMIVLDRHRVQIQDLRRESISDRTPAFVAEGFVSYIGVPLIAKGKVRGVLELFHRSQKKYDEEWIDFLESLAGQAAISIDNAALFDDLQRSNMELSLAYDATIEGWSHALDLRDEGTEGHTQRVTRLTLELAREMGIDDEALIHIRRGAMLHDIGKMGIPDEILHKPDKLNPEELAAMKKHPGYAYEMLLKVRYLRPSLDIPYCHHEKWDGSGYPRGLAGEQIPLAARLFAVVDVWDALISDRPYRAAWSKEKAYKYIKEQSGKYFDPEIAATFLKIIEPALLEE